MYEETLFLLIEYISNLKVSYSFWWADMFEQQSYTIWATVEIYNEVLHNPDIPPEQTIEQFANRMNKYSCKNKETSFMFSIAYDVAMDIYDQYLSMI